MLWFENFDAPIKHPPSSCSSQESSCSSQEPSHSIKESSCSSKEASCEGVWVWEMPEEVAGMTEQGKVGIIDLDEVNVRKGDGLFN